jgi:uncharacterized low-complexity protein
MKKIFIISLLSVMMLSFTGCNDETKKPDDNKVEKKASNEKCNSSGKCGEGKCGGASTSS